MTITPEKKQAIAEKLRVYCERFESQNKAAKSMRGISPATVSQVLNNNWELIADDMWRSMAAQIGYEENEWQAVETRDLRILNMLLSDAQNNHNVYAITGEAGTGKSFSLRLYAQNNRRAHLLSCAEYWNKKMFMQELLIAMGREYSGYTIGEMMQEVVHTLKQQECPLIILDEADKLNDQSLYFFITLYNLLEDRCGIVLVATDHLAKRIKRGRALNKKGYKEIYSRIGRKCIELKGAGTVDITSVCIANGITDRKQIKEVIDESEGDLRRVKRKIHALRLVNNALNNQ